MSLVLVITVNAHADTQTHSHTVHTHIHTRVCAYNFIYDLDQVCSFVLSSIHYFDHKNRFQIFIDA